MVGEREAERRDLQLGFSGRGGPDQRKGKDRSQKVSAGSDVSTGPLRRVRALGILNPTAIAMAMTLSTADISIQLLMDTMNALQEIESRMTARTFAAVVRRQ